MLARLRTFAIFAEHLNFTRAAAAAGLSQPALHAQVRQLGEELGAPLYARQGRNLALTEAGARAAAFARQILEQVESFQAEIQGRRAQSALTLAAGEGSFLYLLGPGIRAFLARDLARLRLLTADAAGALSALRSGEAHVAVASLDAPPPGILAEPLREIAPAVLLPAGHPLAARAALSAADLDGQRLIVPPAGAAHRQALAAALAAAGARWEVAVEAGGWELMRQCVSLNLGLAVVNGFCPPPPGGSAVPFSGLPPRRYLLLTREGAPRTAAVDALLRCLREGAAG